MAERGRQSATGVWDGTKGLPDRSTRVTNLGLDHIPKLINVLLDVEHRQRHGTANEYRRCGKVYPRACPITAEGSVLSAIRRRRPSTLLLLHPVQTGSTDPGAEIEQEGYNGTATLTDSSPKPKHRRTRVWLGMVPQEPVRIEFHRIGVNGRVVQDLPVCGIKPPR